MPHPLNVRFFTPEQEAVFQKCLTNIPFAKDVIVQRLDRVGLSGATVFMFFPGGEHSHPHVGKIHNKKGIQREVEGRDKAYHFFAEATQARFSAEADDGNDLAVLATPLIGNDQNGVTELKDLLFSRKKDFEDLGDPQSFSHEIGTITAAFSAVYTQNCKKAAAGVNLSLKLLGDEYEWYLRRNRTEPLLTTWLGQNVGCDKVELYGEQLPNPLKLIERLKKVEKKLPICTVHGDLHPSNVVINGQGNPFLIDFSWCTTDSHLLKDFLVMECSIRFFMLPRHLSKSAQKLFDTALLDPSPEHIERMLDELKKNVDPGTHMHLQRCANLVAHLRNCAKTACGAHFDNCDYLACQALVLYGLMMIDRYPFDISAHALGLIGGSLQSHDYFG